MMSVRQTKAFWIPIIAVYPPCICTCIYRGRYWTALLGLICVASALNCFLGALDRAKRHLVSQHLTAARNG